MCIFLYIVLSLGLRADPPRSRMIHRRGGNQVRRLAEGGSVLRAAATARGGTVAAAAAAAARDVSAEKRPAFSAARVPESRRRALRVTTRETPIARNGNRISKTPDRISQNGTDRRESGGGCACCSAIPVAAVFFQVRPFFFR